MSIENKLKVAIIGNGNWGTTIAKLVAENVIKHECFDDEVVLGTYEENIENNDAHNNFKTISEEININHTNSKYLPGIALPHNIISRISLDFTDCDILLFCLPHQFINILSEHKFKIEAIGVNLSKGLIFNENINGELFTPSEYISNMLGIKCICLMGANIASEVAKNVLSEATLGICNTDFNFDIKTTMIKLFNSDYFNISVIKYDKSIEICGAVKNIISLAFGIIKGYTEFENLNNCNNSSNTIVLNCNTGCNTLALLFRKGLLEMSRLCEIMNSKLDILSSACIGDLLVSCLCGRNYKCGLEIGRNGNYIFADKSENINSIISEFEVSLNGQKLQGPGTAKEIIKWLHAKKCNISEFPIIKAVYEICYNNQNACILIKALKNENV